MKEISGKPVFNAVQLIELSIQRGAVTASFGLTDKDKQQFNTYGRSDLKDHIEKSTGAKFISDETRTLAQKLCASLEEDAALFLFPNTVAPAKAGEQEEKDDSPRGLITKKQEPRSV